MTSLPSLILEKGKRAFDLNDRVRCYLRPDFVPPETAVDALIATGSRGEARLYDRVPKTRTLTFSVRLVGSSAADVIGAARLLKAFTVDAGDEHEPLYAAFKASNDTPEPLWGQFGAARRYEILSAKVELGNDYMRAARRARAVIAGLTLTLKPYALGKQQRACSAMGGILEDTIGAVDGQSRGVCIPPAITNKFANPVFGHSTWNNGWTAQANLIASKNVDPQFVFFGSNSAHLTAMSAPGNATFYEIINVGNTNPHTLSFYAMKPDRSTISASDVRPRYDATGYATATYTHLGDGLYRVSQVVTGINAGVLAGLIIQTGGVTLYVSGFQMAETSGETPLAYGDLLGCAWTGTAHASTSTRTAAVCKISAAADTFLNAPFSIRLAIKTPPVLGASDCDLLDLRDGTHTTALRLYLASGTTPTLTYNAGTITLAALSANTVYVFHITHNGSTVTLYRNGASGGTSAKAPVVSGADIFWFSNYSGAAQFSGSLMYPATFAVALTSTQVTNDCAELSPLLAAGRPAESLPWLWTKDGDDVVDNCNDSTRDNWCVVGGVPGTAKTPLRFRASIETWDLAGIKALILSRFDSRRFVDPGNLLFDDHSVTADGTACGGGYTQFTVDTSGVFNVAKTIFDPSLANELFGKEVTAIARIYDLGSNLQAATGLTFGAEVVQSTYKAVTAGAAWRLVMAKGIMVPTNEQFGKYPLYTFSPKMFFKRSTGSADVRVDYWMMLPGPVLVIGDGSQSSLYGAVICDGMDVRAMTGAGFIEDRIRASGSELDVIPGRFNLLLAALGFGAVDPAVARTLTFNEMFVTPRYELL